MPAVGLLDCLALNCQLAGLFAGLVAAMWLAAQLSGESDAAGWEVTSLDLEPKFRPDILCDVLRSRQAFQAASRELEHCFTGEIQKALQDVLEFQRLALKPNASPARGVEPGDLGN
ncbi:unnamed protein product [Effrenium voratum]|nr:unnamed protein product [Effrenium voratum]